MRDSIKRLQPHMDESRNGVLYPSVDLGKLSRVETGGYKMEGAVFVTSGIDRQGIHGAIDQLMDRLDQALEEARTKGDK